MWYNISDTISLKHIVRRLLSRDLLLTDCYIVEWEDMVNMNG
jgi:hypothetical protein